MTFLVGELASEIRLEGKEQYARDLQAAGVQTSALAGTNDRLTSAMRTGFQAAATVITTAAVAGTALGVSLFKTGAAYNTLQQTSRAALSTLLGGAEAANAQMDKLDAFARTSPFSKGVFIEAQQQLIGFGLSAEKVVPTLNAIQQGVAAVGGSNQDIAEITRILATVTSSGKITAETLNQLGVRGIDAATLIGQSLGKSGQEIRDSITEGSLDAQVAVQALTDGMMARFNGAADNVKKTWVGTTDRIKAGTREIGVALAEPFISQQGGGYAVEWGNQVADVLQGVRRHAVPVVDILVGRLTPAFNDWTSVLDHANTVVRSWDSSRLENFLNESGRYAPAAAALGGAILGLTSGALSGIPVVNKLLPAINPLAGALIAVAVASPEVRRGALDVLDAFRPLVPVAGNLAGVLAQGITAAAPVAADALGLLADVAGPLVDIVAGIPTPVLAAVAGFLAMRAAAGPLAPVLQRTMEGLAGIAGQVAVQSALARMEGNTSAFAGAMGVARIKADQLSGSLKAAFITNPVGLVLLAVSGAVALLTAALTAQAEEAREAKDRIQAYRETLDETNGSVTDATRKMVAATLASEEWGDRLKDGGVSAKVYANALTGVKGAADEVRKSVVATAREDMLDKTFASASRLAQKLGVDVDTVIAATLGYGDAQDVVNGKITDAGAKGFNLALEYSSLGEKVDKFAGKSQHLVKNLQDQETALGEAKAETKRYNDALSESEAEMADAARSNQRLNDALAIARDVSRDATERISALKLALDELNGGTKSQADLTRDLNEQTDRLRDVFAVTNENGDKLAASLVSAAGAIDTTTAAGRSLFDETTRLNDQMLDAILAEDKLAKARGESGISTERAAEVARPYIDRLREIASGAGLSQEQVDGLVQTMLSTPEVVAFLVDDNGTIDVKQQELLSLAQQIMQTPNGEFVVESDSFPGLAEALRLLGVDITTLPEGTVKVQKDDGSFWTVEQALQGLTKPRYMTIFAQVNSSGAGVGTVLKPDSANGNLFDKGRVQAFANGGFPTGIYAGQAKGLYKFAEPETGWEAFISGRKGQEARNLAIASDAVGRLGGMVITPQQLRSGVLGGSGASHVDKSVTVSVTTTGDGPAPFAEALRLVRQLESRQARKA